MGRKDFVTIEGVSVDPIEHSFDILRSRPGTKIYVGSDSQKKRKTIEYATVIAYRYGRNGCHFIYRRTSVRRKGYGRGDELIRRRLIEEVTETLKTATRLIDNSIRVHQLDFDLNGDPKWKSEAFVSLATGWAAGIGIKSSIKPEVQVASKAANNIVNS